MSRTYLRIAAIAVLLATAGCLPPPLIPAGPDDPTPSEPINFARALELGNMAFDLTANTTVSDATIRQRYGSDTVEVFLFSTVLPGDDGITRFMVLTDNANRRQTVALAGTNTSLQWAFDAFTPLILQDDLSARVHTGWHTLAFSVYDIILPELRTDYPITVTGFSLGAALANIVGEYLLIAGYDVDEVVTFGQPRITDADGVRSFANLPITRFVNDGDPFPDIKADGSGATHFGQMVVLYDGPSYAYVPDGDPLQEQGTGSFFSFEQNEFGFHAEDLYRQRLTEKLNSAQQVVYVP